MDENQDQILLFSAPSLNDQELSTVRNFFETQGMLEETFDEATFLVVTNELQEYIRLKGEYRGKIRALEIVDIVDDTYSGHHISELIDVYHDVIMFRILQDNIYNTSGISQIAVEILAAVPALRSPIYDSEVGDSVSRLIGLSGCSFDNIFQALTASQWRHAFLDVYRCLESLFYFPWMLDLSIRLCSSADLRSMKAACREHLSWNPKEAESLARLFEMCDEPPLRPLESQIEIFKDIISNDNASRRSYAERVYFARNALVHHEDKEHSNKSAPAAADYKLLTLYLTEILIIMNKNNKAKLQV